MKRTVILILILLTFFSCQKEEFNTSNLNANKITALGHGGMGIGYTCPINSYESILKCLNLGMDGTELDVQMSRDSVLVAFHGEYLSDDTDLKGRISSLSWHEIRKAQYRQTPYLNYSIISLEELFSGIEDLNRYQFTFDCKLYNNHLNNDEFYNSYIDALVRIIDKYNIENNIYVESQSKEFLTLFKQKKPAYRLFIYSKPFEAALETAILLDLYGITISTKDINKEQVKTAHDKGLRVAVWGTHSKSDNTEAIRKDPDFIQTDEVKNLIKLLK